MSASEAIVKTWSVGTRTITLSVTRPTRGAPVAAVAEWAPDMPPTLSADELRQYRAGRDRALAEVSAELGINAAVLEL